MSVEAVLTRVNQIVALQQQLADPVQATTPAGSADSPGAAATASAASVSPTFSSALANAQATLEPTSASSDDSLATSPSASQAASLDGLAFFNPAGLSNTTSAGSQPPQVQAMTAMATSLLGKPYVWGGGHAGFAPSSGYDCSGFVSAVLHAGGYLSAPADTDTLPQQAGILQGPGQYVTIYDREDGEVPGQSGHVIIDIAGQFYESGGQSGAWGGGGGVEKIAQPSAAYLATFPNVLHPSGL
jgi:cell wall-associated NlpC family hydrolase